MTNENLIIEMLQKITTGMDEMKAELKAEIAKVKAEVIGINQCLDSLQNTLDGMTQIAKERLQRMKEEQIKHRELIDDIKFPE